MPDWMKKTQPTPVKKENSNCKITRAVKNGKEITEFSGKCSEAQIKYAGKGAEENQEDE